MEVMPTLPSVRNRSHDPLQEGQRKDCLKAEPTRYPPHNQTQCANRIATSQQ